MSEFVSVDQYTALKIEDGGQYGFKLMEGWVDKEGAFRPNFCKRKFKKDGDEKTSPVSLKLGGDQKHAEITLLQCLTDLTGKVYVEKDADVPF